MESDFKKLLEASNAFSEDRKAALRDLFPNLDKKTQNTIMDALKEEVIELEKIRNERDGKLLDIIEEQNA